jgi:hypothetical protein
MHYGRSRYVNAVNEDGVFVTTKVVTKQLCYIPITLRLKWLLLFKEIVRRMRWQ